MAWAQLVAAQSSPVATEYTLSIPSGALTTALDQFSKQTGLQVAAELKTSEQQQRVVEAVIGRFTADAALRKLLAGSDFTYVWEDGSTIRIHKGVVRPHGEGNENEVVVTGSRIGGESPAPVRVYDRADIERYGVSSLSALAGYFTQQSFSSGEWAQRSGAQHYQMRGLGVDTTLVLINGRRAPPSATSVTLNAFDLNTIPITAVDRIEVMSDSASAIYGSDAIGGVVNIILKDDIEAPELYLHYGAAAGGAEERRLALSLGVAGERLKGSLVVDYFERDMLVGAKRDLWRNQDFSRFGGRDYRVTTADRANVYSLTSAPLPGLSTTQASVPMGSTVDLTPADFSATSGVVNRRSSNETWSILPELNRLSAFGSVELTLSEKSAVFGEVLAAKNEVIAQGDMPSLARQVVPASNPYNPFHQPVAVDYSMVGMEPMSQITESTFTRLVLGARGRLYRWDWEVSFVGGDEGVDSTRVNGLDFGKVQSALASTDRGTALNPFTDGPAGNESLLSTLIADPQVIDYSSRGFQGAGFLRGELFRMPSGVSEFVFGAEWRREKLKFFDAFALQHSRDVVSGFAEMKLPVLTDLWVKLALRGDYYDNASDSVNPQYGLVWHPAQDWLVRLAYGTSFRPPSLPEQYSPRREYLVSVADPRRAGSVFPVRLLAGGNPDLENVSAHSFTGGFEYQPDGWPGFRWGTHYWRVVMDNRIIVPRFADIGRIEAAFPERVMRSAPTATDVTAGWPGVLESVDISMLNFGRLETSGIDFDLSHRVQGELGRLQSVIAATWVATYAAQDLGSSAPVDRVGIASLQGTIPRWRLVSSLTWERGGGGVSTTASFTPRYWDADVPGGLKRRLPSRTLVDVQAWVHLDRILQSGVSDGLMLTAGVTNVFDRDADFANAGSFLGFDVSQADLKQRFAYLRLTKTF